MEGDQQYIIPYKGLKDGEHTFDFVLDNEFFECHDALDSNGGEVKITTLLNRKTRLLELSCKLEGSISLVCDRCLEYFDYKLNMQQELIVKFTNEETSLDDEIWFLNDQEDDLDLFQFFYDTIGVSLPISKMHPDLENGEPGCSVDEYEQDGESESDEEIDPRWSALKDLYKNNNDNN